MIGGSMFSGIGGFDEAAERAGITLAWQSEIEPFARKVLRRRFPAAELHGDVTKIKGAEVGAIDILMGGFPCQDVSVAGKRAGLAGERTGLFWEIVRLADECRPRWLLLENVPGLLSSNERRDFGAVLGALGELGYGYASRVLDAQYMRVAQRRRRVFIVGCLGDAGRAAEVLFEPESCARHPAPSRQPGTRAAYSLAASIRGTGDGHGNAWNTDYVYNRYRNLERDGSVSEGFKPDGIVDALYGPTGNKEPLVAATLNSGGNSGGFRTEPGEHLVAAALLSSKAGYRSDLETETYVTHTLSAEIHDASEDGTGRGTPLVFANTAGATALGLSKPGVPPLTNRHGDPGIAFDGGVGVRRLMPVECERLQGFPDGWTCLHDHPQQCDCPDSPRYRALGNAVAVPVAEWILRRLVRVHNGERLGEQTALKAVA